MKTTLPLSHKRPANFSRFWFGAAYYPEHWDEATRADDPARMKAAGFNVVRLAEFSWDLMEPREGQYDFSFYDEQIARLGQAGVSTILCTPTAAPPRWLTVQHPEILRVNAAGVRMQHGSRQQACVSSPVFRDYSRRITQAMAGHFRDNPQVVGWQTDNEFYCHIDECHCPACQQAFGEFLRQKFGDDIGALNRAWGTAFWALTFGSFAAVLTPRRDQPTYPNPAHELDFKRFLTATVTEFQREQVTILRAAQSRWFVTHNGLFNNIDYRGEFTRDLDMLGYDCYPMFHFNPAERAYSQAFNLDQTRAWSGNFIIPEQQSGPGGQQPYFHSNPEPGELRKMTYVSIARGADSLLYFRWRTCRFGAEEYWCGILDHDSVPRRRYAEVQQVGEELQRVGPAVLGTHVRVDVAVAGGDFVNNAAHDTLPFGLPHPRHMSVNLHRHFYERGYAVGLVHPTDDLADVKLFCVPHWVVFDPAWVTPLRRWVEAGGVLVIGARTATRDANNNVVAETIPGSLRELAGVTVEEYGKQNLPAARPLRLTLTGKSVPTDHWYEWLQLDRDTKPLAKWKGRHLTGKVAVSTRRVGKGQVVYVGTYFTQPVADALLPALTKLAGVKSLWPGVEVVCRQNAEKRLWFFINHQERTVTIKQPPRGVDLITGKKTGKTLALRPNDIAVVQAT